MGRKIRHQFLTGSMLQPFFQFTKKLEVSINPINDPKGAKIGEHMHKWANSIKPKFKGENFQTTLQYDLTSSSSYVVFHYLNGWKQGFHLKQNSMIAIENNHKVINAGVEFERALQGHEDEYEDEEKK